MTEEQAYQLSMAIVRAANAGKPMPEVPQEHRKVAEDLYRRFAKHFYTDAKAMYANNA